ncbi:MAG: molybdopterin molybdotransferase MoeA [Planctomycetota bacterium]|jgi:molybdopterin molybdotransferase
MPENKEMILLAEALEIIERQLAAINLSSEMIPVRQAAGRIVVEEQVSVLDVPAFNKSAMDGYAVSFGDEREEYIVLETVPAGSVPSKKLVPGTATKVMTGAVVPEGTGKVIMVEQTSEDDGRIRVLSQSDATNICCKGEDVRYGDVILQAYTLLGPREIANLICAGITEVKAAKRIRVSIISTGSELVDSFDQIIPGRIMNSNGPMLFGLCEKYGLEVLSDSIVQDELDATVSVLADALDKSDIVVLSGGVSVGDFDFVTEASRQARQTDDFCLIGQKGCFWLTW